MRGILIFLATGMHLNIISYDELKSKTNSACCHYSHGKQIIHGHLVLYHVEVVVVYNTIRRYHDEVQGPFVF